MKLTSSQKKINIASVLGVIILIVLWVFIYLPRTQKLYQLKNALNVMEKNIEKKEQALLKEEMTPQRTRLTEEQIQKIERKFPMKEEESLGLISDLGRKLNLEIVSFTTTPKTLFLDETGHKVTIDGKDCYFVRLSIEMKSSFKNLVDAIIALKKDIPAYITIENLQIRKDSDLKKLLVSMELHLFLLN